MRELMLKLLRLKEEDKFSAEEVSVSFPDLLGLTSKDAHQTVTVVLPFLLEALNHFAVVLGASIDLNFHREFLFHVRRSGGLNMAVSFLNPSSRLGV